MYSLIRTWKWLNDFPLIFNFIYPKQNESLYSWIFKSQNLSILEVERCMVSMQTLWHHLEIGWDLLRQIEPHLHSIFKHHQKCDRFRAVSDNLCMYTRPGEIAAVGDALTIPPPFALLINEPFRGHKIHYILGGINFLIGSKNVCILVYSYPAYLE